MRFACAFRKTQIEDCEDKVARMGEVIGVSAKFSSAIAIVAQDRHSIMRRI
jgi:hypothetical protein